MQLPTLTILRRLSVDERSSAGVLLGQEAEDDALENVRGLTADAVAYAVEYYQLGVGKLLCSLLCVVGHKGSP